MNTQPTTSVLAIIFFLTLFITWLLTRITHFIFQKFYTIHKGIHLRFFERLISAVIMVAGVILAISFFVGMDDVWKTVLGEPPSPVVSSFLLRRMPSRIFLQA